MKPEYHIRSAHTLLARIAPVAAQRVQDSPEASPGAVSILAVHAALSWALNEPGGESVANLLVGAEQAGNLEAVLDQLVGVA